MLWRVRTTLADRPGALAALARHCGERSVNILGLQIFPGVEGVTDELVLSSPAGWTLAEVAALVESAGGTAVSVGRAPSMPWSTVRPATSTPYGAWCTAPTASPTRWRG